MTGIQKLLNLGIEKNAPKISTKQTRLLNTYILTWLLFSFFLAVSDFYYVKNLESTIGHATAFSIMLLLLFFNSKGYYYITASLLIVQAYLNFLLFSLIISPGIFSEFFFLFLPCLSISLFNNKIIPWITLIVCTVTTYIILIYFNHYGGVFPPILIFVLFVSTFLVTNYLKVANQKNEAIIINEKKVIEQQAAELKALNEFKSHFFVNLSHEIRTPLTLLGGYLKRIDSNTKANKKYLPLVAKQGKRIQDIVDDIIDLSKLDTDEFHIQRKTINITQVITKVHREFSHLFEQKNITWNLDIPNLDISIKADFALIRRAITNLITNTLKFTSEGGEASIVITVKSNLMIEFIDNGIGIPEKDIELIFKRYYQSKNHITKSVGSGIGLSLTKAILNNHGYSIKANSIQNMKTVFAIKIPENQFTIATTDNDKESQKVNTLFLEKSLILIVDDHPEMLTYLNETLSEKYETIIAKNGKEALDILKNNLVDLVITDYMMPTMDGHEFKQKMIEKQLNIPTIVLTARRDMESKLNMMRIGVDSYLQKPFDEEELFLTIAYCLNNENKRKQFVENNAIKDTELDPDKDFIIQLRKVINKKMSDSNFSVVELAEDMLITERTLYRKTKALTGCSPKQIILECRMKRAKEIFENKDYKSKRQLAMDVGYKNTTYFNKLFTEYFKIENLD